MNTAEYLKTTLGTTLSGVVFDETLTEEPLSLENAVKILNLVQYRDNYIGGRLIEWFIEYHNYNMVSARFIFNKGLPNECISDTQFFTPFEACAVAEKLLREGK